MRRCSACSGISLAASECQLVVIGLNRLLIVKFWAVNNELASAIAVAEAQQPALRPCSIFAVAQLAGMSDVE